MNLRTLIRFSDPSPEEMRELLAGAAQSEFAYTPIGASQHAAHVAGFENDHERVCIGQGDRVFEAAHEAFHEWAMFPAPMAVAYPARAPIKVGTTVVTLLHIFGLTWVTTSRIVYVIDERGPHRRFGFGYGTLSLHPEAGEERFLIEQLPDGSVWYGIFAFSRPQLWLARLGFPMVRALQHEFRTRSGAALLRTVQQRVQSGER